MAKPLTLAGEMAARMRAIAERHEGQQWPARQWQEAPVLFADKILGVRLWSAQEDIVESIRENKRTSVVGGRKIGKDFAIAVACLWWYAAFDDARAFMTATTGRQVDGILYRQVRSLYVRSGKCYACVQEDKEKIKRGEQPLPPPCAHSTMLTGKLGELARTGLTAPDLREVKGFTAKDEEGVAGMSGANLLTVVDEASGYPDHLHVGIRGNLAAENCREVLISNGTKARGFFFDSHHSKAHLYKTIAVSSLDTPNVVEDRQVFPGLASRAWVEECKIEWGEDSALYKIHVLGQFVLQEAGAIFSVDAIHQAELRWHDEIGEGPLVIGVDCAGDSGEGDDSCFVPVRGKKALEIYERKGLTAEGHVVEVLGLVAKHSKGGERVRINIDREGIVGNKVYGAFIAYQEAHQQSQIDVVGIRASERAIRQPKVYDRIRDELCANLADWFRDGGAIPPENVKLAKELNVFRWIEHVSGRRKATPKSEIIKEIHRSPDRADGLSLGVWGESAIGATTETEGGPAAAPPPPLDSYEQRGEQVFDPYGGRDAFRR